MCYLILPSQYWLHACFCPCQPPLVQACFHGDPDEVRALLYKKEDVNYQVWYYIDLMFVFSNFDINNTIRFVYLIT